MILGAFLVSLLLVSLGCGPSGSAGDKDGPIPELVSIEVQPADARLVIDGDVPALAAFSAIGTFVDGHKEDISERVRFTITDTRLGSFAGFVFTSSTALGGRTEVQASDAQVFGHAQLTLVLQKRYRDPAATGLVANPGGLFDGASPGPSNRRPSLVYPNDQVLVPPNLSELEFHLRPGQDNSIFELSFTSAFLDILVYTQCTNPLAGGCIFRPTRELWSWIAESSLGESVSVKVRGTDASGALFGESSSIAIRFARDDLRGGIYYWATPSGGSDADSAVLRWDFGSATQSEPQLVVTTALTNNQCVGCHALARDGTRMVVASSGSYDAYVLLFDLISQLPLVPYNSTPPSAFSSFNPDGSQFVGTFADESQAGFQSYDLNLFEGSTGAYVESIAVGGSEQSPITHPDWSPSGDQIVFTRIGEAVNTANGTTVYGRQSHIEFIQREGPGWSAPVSLTNSTPGSSTYYPGYSPDNSIIVFNRSSCANGLNGEDCDMYDDPGAAMYVMRPAQDAVPVALARANAGGVEDTLAVVENSFPRWAPFVFQEQSEFGSRLMWLTFSSNRRLGLYEPESGFTLLWMCAIDPDRVAQGEDPSFAAFALPFQDLSTDNHTAQWTERVVGKID